MIMRKERSHLLPQPFTPFSAATPAELRRELADFKQTLGTMTRELEVARAIQRASFPSELPQPGNFTLAGRWESAREVAGDFYDALPLSDGSLLLVMADVMGKGVPAAMFAMITGALIRVLATHHHQPSELLTRLNTLLYDELSAVDMFITVQLVRIDLHRRHAVVASAGHCPAMFMAAGQPVRDLGPTGTPLGVLRDPVYDEESATLEGPALLLIYTDGLTEAVNPHGEMFGRQRLIDWVNNKARSPDMAEHLCERLASDVSRFRGDTPLRDDQAFLIFADKPTPSIPARRRSQEVESANSNPAPPITS